MYKQLSSHFISVCHLYLQELNCFPAGGGLDGWPNPDPPPPPPKAGAEPVAIEPNV